MIQDTIVSNLQSGVYGLLALSAVIGVPLIPLTLYKKMYGFTVGYGYSCMFAAIILMLVFPEATICARSLDLACVFYGGRLGSYLLFRESTRSKSPSSKMDNGSIVSRIVMSVSLALFYAMMMTPVLYALRYSKSSSLEQQDDGFTKLNFGCHLSWFGAVLEAIADLQKFVKKQRHQSKPSSINGDKKGKDDKEIFIGPTGGAYWISRHPNYLGEVLFWTGQCIGGIPFFESGSIQPWLWSGLGWMGILSIMRMATRRLEKQQHEKYGGQKNYEEWTHKVTGSLCPLIP